MPNIGYIYFLNQFLMNHNFVNNKKIRKSG